MRVCFFTANLTCAASFVALGVWGPALLSAFMAWWVWMDG